MGVGRCLVQRTNGFGLNLTELTRNNGLVPESEEFLGNFAGMSLSQTQREKLKPKEKPDMYSVIAKDASRMNHSCSPNTLFEFSLTSFSVQFYAMRDIKAGEEIFFSYTHVYAPAARRREQLEAYGFTCTCTACSLATPESDKLRETSISNLKIIESLYHMAKDYDQKNHNGMKSVRETILPTVLDFRTKLREEGLGVMFGPYLSSSILLHDLYVNIGMVEEPECRSVLKDVAVWMMMKVGTMNGVSEIDAVESMVADIEEVSKKKMKAVEHLFVKTD